MDFSLSEEQEMFRNYVRKSLAGLEGTQIARNYLLGDNEAFKTAYATLAELGCTSLNIDEQYGGMGLQALDLVPVYEEAGAVLLPNLLLETLSFAVPIIQTYGTEQQKQLYLPKIADGSIQFSIAWLEPESSYRSAGIQLQAQDGKLNGKKILVPDTAMADYLIVVARTAEGKTNEGISLIIVPTADASIQPQLNIDSTRKVAATVFHELAYDETQILGHINDGWSILQHGLQSLNSGMSAMIVGAMERIVATVTEYANIREQFGQPIGRFQAVKHRIVEMKMDLETAKSLTHYANWAYDMHAEDQTQAILSARLFTTEAFNRVAAHSVQIHGGIGFTEELDCHLYVKRARFYENYLGSTEQLYEEAANALGW